MQIKRTLCKSQRGLLFLSIKCLLGYSPFFCWFFSKFLNMKPFGSRSGPIFCPAIYLAWSGSKLYAKLTRRWNFCGQRVKTLNELLLLYIKIMTIEPVHEISNKWYVRPARPQVSLSIRAVCLIRVFANSLNIQWLLSYWLNIIWSFWA